MKKKNLVLRYFGLLLLIIGIALNIKMYIDEDWPTYLFYMISTIGILQIIISLFCKQMKISWQIFLALFPIILGCIFIKQIG